MMIMMVVIVVGMMGMSEGQAVGPTPCGEVPPIETDAFNPRDQWSQADKNYTVYDVSLSFSAILFYVSILQLPNIIRPFFTI